jgi:hypothetical protein
MHRVGSGQEEPGDCPQGAPAMFFNHRACLDRIVPVKIEWSLSSTLFSVGGPVGSS